MLRSNAPSDASAPIRVGRGRARNQIAAALPVADTGQPISDLPPLVEPTGFAPAAHTLGRRPPRQRFLAPAPPAGAPAEIIPFNTPRLIEPIPFPPDRAPRPDAWAYLLRWLLAAARALLPDERRSRIAALAAGAIALGFVLAFAVIPGFGPASVRHFPVSAAPRDPAQRFSYFQEGARAGEAEAELQLAIMFARGDGVAQDYATAATWFRAAAEQGIPRAQYDLGVIYERGRGANVDLAEAARWYRRAAQAGYPLAQYNLAVCYTRGQGVRQDLPEAALWYHRAAAQGVVQAMINLGTMYDKGEGVAASPVDAYAWYLAAGQRDSRAAQRRAEDIFNALPRLDQIRAEALASDVAGSIHDPVAESSTPAPGSPDATSATSVH